MQWQWWRRLFFLVYRLNEYKTLFVYSGYPVQIFLFESNGAENGPTILNDKMKTKYKEEDIPLDGNTSRTLGNILARKFCCYGNNSRHSEGKQLTLLFQVISGKVVKRGI